MKKKNSEKILELQYTIAALEDELNDLAEMRRIDGARIGELIGENDRLTMTYEPYRPPNDPHVDLDFYGLIEERDELVEEVKRLQLKNRQLTSDLIDIRTAVVEMKVAKEKKKRYPKAGVISFDFWPPRDWFRLSYHKWNPGKSAQLCIGPLRIDWFQS